MILGRYYSKLSGHKLHGKLKKSQPLGGDRQNVILVGEANLNVGTALAMLGGRAEAAESLHRAITILEKAAAANPKQEEINWDLTVAYVWAASIEPDTKAALGNYKKALAVNQRLSGTDTETSMLRE